MPRISTLATWIWQKLVQPTSPYPLAAFRIALGFILILNGLLLLPDLGVWFSQEAVTSLATILSIQSPGRLNLFVMFGDSPATVAAVMAAYLLAAMAFLVGWRPRIMAAIFFVCLVSLNHRNPLAFTSGDALLRLLSFFFIFAPSATVWAIRQEPAPGGRICPMAFRLMQFQVCLVYFSGFLAKLQGSMWRDGTAVYVVQQLSEFERLPLPALFTTPWVCQVLTWGTLALEGSFPFLVWFKETRLPILGALVLFHLGIEYSMNIQLFEWTMIVCSLLFLREEEVRGAVGWVHRRIWPQACRSKKGLDTRG